MRGPTAKPAVSASAERRAPAPAGASAESSLTQALPTENTAPETTPVSSRPAYRPGEPHWPVMRTPVARRGSAVKVSISGRRP